MTRTAAGVNGAADRGKDLVRQYAAIMGAVVLLLGTGGLPEGNRQLGGFLPLDLAEDLIHLAAGILLLYAGFGQRGISFVRTVLLMVGVAYVLLGLLGLIVPDLFGLLPHEYSMVDNLTHLAIGAANLVVARISRRQATA